MSYLSPSIMASVMDSSPIPCVDIVFFDKDVMRTLLFKRVNAPGEGAWFTAGGRVHKNESLINCAIRKAFDELGLIIDPRKLIGPVVTEDFWNDSVFPGVSYHPIVICFGYIIDDAAAEQITMDNQHTDRAWLPLGNPSLHQYVQERLALLKPFL